MRFEEILADKVLMNPNRLIRQQVKYCLPNGAVLAVLDKPEAQELVLSKKASVAGDDKIVELVCPDCENMGMVFKDDGTEEYCSLCRWGAELKAEAAEYGGGCNA